MGVWPDFEAPPQYKDAAPGWEDPALPNFRLIWEVARKLGYSIGLHGSMRRDCDLIAAPWAATAGSDEYLVEALCTCLDARVIGGPEDKPHGRRAWSLQIDGWVKTIDLSVMPRV